MLSKEDGLEVTWKRLSEMQSFLEIRFPGNEVSSTDEVAKNSEPEAGVSSHTAVIKPFAELPGGPFPLTGGTGHWKRVRENKGGWPLF